MSPTFQTCHQNHPSLGFKGKLRQMLTLQGTISIASMSLVALPGMYSVSALLSDCTQVISPWSATNALMDLWKVLVASHDR